MEAQDWAVPQGEISTQELDRQVAELQKAWDIYDEKAKQAKELKEAYDKKEAQVLELLRLAGKTKYFVEGLGTVYKINRFQVTTPKTIESKTELFKYLQKTKGIEFAWSLFGTNSQSLNSFYNRELEEAKEAGKEFNIPGLDEPTHKESLGFRKERK